MVIGIDGATNVLSRNVSNVIAHTPRPWFVEYVRTDLKESVVELVKKVKEIFQTLLAYVCRGVVDGFMSDSCNAMRALRRELRQCNLVVWEYGCASHSLNNFCEVILYLPDFKCKLRRGLFLSKSIKDNGMVGKVFRALSLELFGKAYAMVLYSVSRWSSVNYMFLRLKKVKLAITRLPS